MASFPILERMSIRTKLLRERFPMGDDLAEVFAESSDRMAAWFTEQLVGSETISRVQAESLIETLGPSGELVSNKALGKIIDEIKSKSAEYCAYLLVDHDQLADPTNQRADLPVAAPPQQHHAPEPALDATEIQSKTLEIQKTFTSTTTCHCLCGKVCGASMLATMCCSCRSPDSWFSWAWST